MPESLKRTFAMPDLSELGPDEREVAIFAQQMRDKNAGLSSQIEQLGGSVDVAAAKTEHLLNALVAFGVVTELQRWQIEADWERTLNRQLKPVHARLVEAHREKLRQKNKPAIILPPGMKRGDE